MEIWNILIFWFFFFQLTFDLTFPFSDSFPVRLARDYRAHVKTSIFISNGQRKRNVISK